MKAKPQIRTLREVLGGKSRSIFDLETAVARLNRELDRVEALEPPVEEPGRIFAIETKRYDAGMMDGGDGAVRPILVVRFPVLVEDQEEWSRRCREWRQNRPPVATADVVADQVLNADEPVRARAAAAASSRQNSATSSTPTRSIRVIRLSDMGEGGVGA